MDLQHLPIGRVRELSLTALGLGASQFGNLNRETTDEASLAAVDEAWRRGIRYFDTAPHYGLGLSERRLGAALAGRPRDEYVVSTKVGRLVRPNPAGAGRLDDEGFVVPADLRRVRDYSRDGVLTSIEESLQRLGLDRIDIAYLHDPDDFWEEASTSGVEALVELRDQGVLGAVGVGMNQARILTRFIRETDVDLVMCAGRYTLLDRHAEDELLPAALERGVGVVAAGVYNSGILSTDRPPAHAHYDYVDAPEAVLREAEAIADLCERFGTTTPVVATQFAARHPAVISTVVGLRTAAHVRSAVERAVATVPAELWAALDARQRQPEFDRGEQQ